MLGSGGREHALAWKLGCESDTRVWVAPGNDGMAADPKIEACVDVDILDFQDLTSWVLDNDIDLTVVGPERPLCEGIVDYFSERDLLIVGPTQVAAELEASKSFAKEVMVRAGVPTADYRSFVSLRDAETYVRQHVHPVVLKADGLAGGKGVVISESVETSERVLQEFMDDEKFGDASKKVVIEEFLSGPELSFICLTDSSRVLAFSTSRDHKPLEEGGRGPNTGGMGAITPSPDSDPDLEARLLDDVVRPVLREMEEMGRPFSGFLYAGLMLTENGPRVLEFNVRMGDPETQALLFALDGDLGPILESCARGALPAATTWRFSAACCVVLASKGYPFKPEIGFPIGGLDNDFAEDIKIFHAGTRRVDSGFLTAGGRVLSVVARGSTPQGARRRAYEVVDQIDWTGMTYRRDVGGLDS